MLTGSFWPSQIFEMGAGVVVVGSTSDGGGQDSLLGTGWLGSVHPLSVQFRIGFPHDLPGDRIPSSPLTVHPRGSTQS